MEKEFKGTKGKITSYNFEGKGAIIDITIDEGDIDTNPLIAQVYSLIEYENPHQCEQDKELLTNVETIKDALNIRQQIDFSLTELLQKYKELREENERLKFQSKELYEAGMNGIEYVDRSNSPGRSSQAKRRLRNLFKP